MRRERGQAGIETLVVLPLLLLCVLTGAQVVVWAAGAILAGTAAGAGARAVSRGDPPEPASLAELPGPLRRLVRVRVRDDGVVRVVLRVPSLIPGGPTLEASASAHP